MQSLRLRTLFARTFRVWRTRGATLLSLGILWNLAVFVHGAGSLTATFGLPTSLASQLLQQVGSSLLDGAVAYATVRALQDRKIGPLAASAVALRRAHLLIPVGFVSSYALSAMQLHPLFLIPALYVVTTFLLAAPIAVLDDLGLRDTLRRSAAMSSGFRIHLLSILALLFLVMSVITHLWEQLMSPQSDALYGAGLMLLWAIFSALVASVIAALYMEIRTRVGPLRGLGLAP